MLYDNKYEYIKLLGKGGFGEVFLAQEKTSDRFVAIKRLIDVSKSEQDDIIHEIKIISKFQSSNIVTYYHHFWQNDQLFLVMEYCEGGSLRDKLKTGKSSTNDVFNWIVSLTECLNYVHKKDIFHHDIKPDNVLFTDEGKIKISDFGVANKGAGTRAYMSPEALAWNENSIKDPRVDIYALGVTLMELLTGINPFYLLSNQQILELHETGKFPILHLPNWQQEIILKAINKVPELRFQYMGEFKEAIQARTIPIIFKKESLKAAQLAESAETALKRKKWRNAGKYLELASERYPDNVSVLQVYGKYYLQMQKIAEAKKCFEKALRLNPRLNLQKDLGWINVEKRNYPLAIGFLSDHLHRNPSDYEAYNLLLQCYYETDRYEPAMELAEMLLEDNDQEPCFINNYYVCSVMNEIGKVVLPKADPKRENAFIDYNLSVVIENQESHNYKNTPTLKSKLLFMDNRFNNYIKNTFSISEDKYAADWISFQKPIIKIGREGYETNDITAKGTSVSRRHCVVLNFKNDVWVYDLDSTGTFVNGERINRKTRIIGVNKLGIGNTDFKITTDKSMLL